MDIVQPWTVGRYRDVASAYNWKSEMLVPDLALAAKNEQINMPVIFAGFSLAHSAAGIGNEPNPAESRRILLATGV